MVRKMRSFSEICEDIEHDFEILEQQIFEYDKILSHSDKLSNESDDLIFDMNIEIAINEELNGINKRTNKIM